MNSNPLTPGSASENWLELRLQQAAPAFPYPPTPDIAGNVRRQLERLPARPAHRAALRPAWLLALFLLAAAALFAIPGVRAAVLEFIQVGVVRIFLVEPTPPPQHYPPNPPTPAYPDLFSAEPGRRNHPGGGHRTEHPARPPAVLSA